MSRPSRNPTSGLPSVVCQAKLDPFFSIPYTLFAIHNLPYPFCFETTASFLQETPRGGGCPNVPEIPSACVTPLESISFKILPCKPFRISLFHKYPVRALVVSSSTATLRALLSGRIFLPLSSSRQTTSNKLQNDSYLHERALAAASFEGNLGIRFRR